MEKTQPNQVATGNPQVSLLSIEIKAPFQGMMFCPFQNDLQNYIADTRKKQKSLEELDIWNQLLHSYSTLYCIFTFTKYILNHSINKINPFESSIQAFRFFLRVSATFLMKSIVLTHLSRDTSLVPSTQIAKSFVIIPLSTVSITDLSRVLAKFSSC